MWLTVLDRVKDKHKTKYQGRDRFRSDDLGRESFKIEVPASIYYWPASSLETDKHTIDDDHPVEARSFELHFVHVHGGHALANEHPVQMDDGIGS